MVLTLDSGSVDSVISSSVAGLGSLGGGETVRSWFVWRYHRGTRRPFPRSIVYCSTATEVFALSHVPTEQVVFTYTYNSIQ